MHCGIAQYANRPQQISLPFAYTILRRLGQVIAAAGQFFRVESAQ
jgi:hypothetical protein